MKSHCILKSCGQIDRCIMTPLEGGSKFNVLLPLALFIVLWVSDLILFVDQYVSVLSPAQKVPLKRHRTGYLKDSRLHLVIKPCNRSQAGAEQKTEALVFFSVDWT